LKINQAGVATVLDLLMISNAIRLSSMKQELSKMFSNKATFCLYASSTFNR